MITIADEIEYLEQLRAAERMKKQEAREQRKQVKRERHAREHVTPWSKLKERDYNFLRGNGWANAASETLIRAGCVYEYARESQKLRCLLFIIQDAQKRGDSGPCSFQDLYEHEVNRRLGRALDWLSSFADELAANVSFAELLQLKSRRVRRSLTNFPAHRTYGTIALATANPSHDVPPPWPWRPYSPFGPTFIRFGVEGPGAYMPERNIDSDGSEQIAIEIPWGNLTNTEIAKEMAKFGKANRPSNEECRQPTRPGPRPKEIAVAKLKALAVIRIGKLFHDQWKRLEQVAENCRYKGCVRELKNYRERRREGSANEPMDWSAKAEMSGARNDCLKYFHRFSPGEMPSNWQK